MDFFKRNILWVIAFALAVLFFGGYCFLLSPPANFPSGSIIVIAQGTSTPDVAKELADAHVIAHPSFLRLVLRVSGKSNQIPAGAYRFETPQNLFVIAYRLVTGAFDLPLVRVTFPEGTTVQDAAEQIADAFPTLSVKDFVSAGKSYEGYLFPDTYFFQPGIDSASIVKTMRANFDAKTAPLSGEIQAFGHSLSDTVILASLVEKEARTDADKRIVAGILWNRLTLGMPLQVDASRDTYTYVGLPPTPICNPGLDSIEAILRPTKTDYLYYLTGKDGLMHYATTFAGHQANLRKYLN